MADRTINININITGGTGSGGGTTGGGTSGGATSKQQNAAELKKATAVAIEEEKRKTAAIQQEEKRLTQAQKAELNQRATNEKRAYQQQTQEAKKAAQAQQAELRKTAAAMNNTWANALKSYQFKFNALGNIISNVVSTATRMLYELGSSIVTVSKDFEFAMSGVKAITMATDKEFKMLRDDAVRLGGQTIFTASDVAKLQEELAKLGFTVSEIRAATDGVVALAAATGEDLAQSALVAGTVIRGFGLNANELTRVVDIMTESFNRSALDLYKFQETMKYVAPIAAKVGFTLEETTAMMSKLADQGIIASQAGTGLRNIMLRLADANSKLSKAMGGSAKSLPELIVGLQKLKEGGIDATGALKLVDRYSVTAFLGLVKSSDKIWEMYKNLVLVSGSAQKMSDIRMDNFAGSVEKLKGAWQSFVLTINKGNSALRGVVDAARWAIDGVSKLLQSTETKAGIAGEQQFKEFKDSIQQSEHMALVEMVKAQDKRLTEFRMANDKSKKAYEEFQKDMRAIERKANEDKIKAREQTDVKIKQLEEDLATQFGTPLFPQGTDEIMNAPMDKFRKEEFIKMITYYKELKQLQASYQQEAIMAEIDYNAELADEMEKMTAEELRAAKELAQLKVDLMIKGFDREIAEVNKDYDELKAKAIEFGLDFKQSEINRQEELLEIRKKYWQLYKDFYEDELDQRGGTILINLKPMDILPIEPSDIEEKKSKLNDFYQSIYDLSAKLIPATKEGVAARLELLDKLLKEQEEKLKGFKDKVDKVIIGDEKEKPTTPSIWERLKIDSEAEQAIKQGFSFITSELEKIADKETEIADRRVENSQRVVDQLQEDLQTEIALAEQGFASNVSLKRRQLDEAKKEQAQALAMQKEAIKQQQTMQSLLQAVNLISATANILNSMTQLGPAGLVLAIAEIATMWGVFGYAQVKARQMTKYGEGGEIEGKKHSQGGVPIEAEGGEFVVKASAYNKNRELVQAINNEDMANVYRALNQDLSVSLDDTNTAKMLGKHFKDKKEITYFNGGRIETKGNRRRIIRYAQL